MRKMPNYHNLGLRNEAYILCSQRNLDFFTQVGALMTAQGLMTGLACYDDGSPLTPTLKKQLRRSYYVLFMLEEGVVEESVGSPKGSPNQFLQLYGYVNRTNRKAICCVTVNGCKIQPDLKYPFRMRGFKKLHRIPCQTHIAPAQAQELCKQLRRTLPLARRDLLRHLQENGCNAHSQYYDETRKPALWGLAAGAFMQLVLLFGPGYVTSEKVLLFLSILILFMLAILTVMTTSAILKACKSKVLISQASRTGNEKAEQLYSVKKGGYVLSFLVTGTWLMFLFAFVMAIREAAALPVGQIVILGYMMYDGSVLLEGALLQKKLPSMFYITASREFLMFRKRSRWIRVSLLVLLSIITLVYQLRA